MAKQDEDPSRGGGTPDADKAEEADKSGEASKEQEREDDLLDEGLEETFPASDPVSAKHIN